MAVPEPIRNQGQLTVNMFLGFRFHLTDTGKVILILDPRNIKAERKKLARLVKKCKRGGLTRDKVDESYRAWRNHAEKGNSYHLLQRMDQYYRDLWKGENPHDENH